MVVVIPVDRQYGDLRKYPPETFLVYLVRIAPVAAAQQEVRWRLIQRARYVLQLSVHITHRKYPHRSPL